MAGWFAKIPAPDVFAAPRYKEEQITTVISKIGTLIACSLLFALSIVQLVKYGRAESSVSPSTIPRNASLEMMPPAIAIIVLAQGGTTPFLNLSYFRTVFQYKVIYYGNSKKDQDQYKPVTIDIPTTTCKAFYDLEVYKDPKVTRTRLLNETEVEGGKKALGGCPDWIAADKILRKARLDGVLGAREGGHLQGKYGEPMYWWLQARIQPCVMYSKELGIKCVNESLVEDLFKQGVTTDIVTLDQLSRDSFTWGNIYVTVDKTRWMGYEIFLRPIVHIEEDKNLPSVYYPEPFTFSKLDYWDVRSEPRFAASDYYITMYFRMSGLINRNYVKYYSLEDALTKIGSWERILWMIVGTICIYYNLKTFKNEEEQTVMSAPFIIDESTEVMDIDSAQEKLSKIDPNTHEAKMLRRAISIRSAAGSNGHNGPGRSRLSSEESHKASKFSTELEGEGAEKVDTGGSHGHFSVRPLGAVHGVQPKPAGKDIGHGAWPHLNVAAIGQGIANFTGSLQVSPRRDNNGIFRNKGDDKERAEIPKPKPRAGSPILRTISPLKRYETHDGHVPSIHCHFQDDGLPKDGIAFNSSINGGYGSGHNGHNGNASVNGGYGNGHNGHASVNGGYGNGHNGNASVNGGYGNGHNGAYNGHAENFNGNKPGSNSGYQNGQRSGSPYAASHEVNGAEGLQQAGVYMGAAALGTRQQMQREMTPTAPLPEMTPTAPLPDPDVQVSSAPTGQDHVFFTDMRGGTVSPPTSGGGVTVGHRSHGAISSPRQERPVDPRFTESAGGSHQWA